MQVFKYYFTLAKSVWPVIVIYVSTFALIMFLIISQTPKTGATFEAQKPSVAVFNYDKSELSKGLESYLKNNSTEVKIADTDEARKEAIYFQPGTAIYTIPKDFGKNFTDGQKPTVAVMGDVSQGGIQSNTLVSNYLRLAEVRAMAGMSQAEIIKGVNSDVKKQISVKTKSSNNVNEVSKAMRFMNTLSYVFVGLSIAVISAIMIMFSDKMIRRRNEVGGISNMSVTLQIFAGNSVFMVAMWAIFVAICFIMYPAPMSSTAGLLFVVGSLLFALVCLGISFFIGSIVTNRRAIAGITNVLALGMGFLCGVFVPIEFLGDSVVKLSKMLPAYWYIQANEKIPKLTDFSYESLRPIYGDWLIVAIFAVGLFAVTFIYRRWHRR